MWSYIIIGIIVLIVIYGIILINSFIKLDNRVSEAFSTMDVYLKKRWDLIPNLVEIVKCYVKHESDTLTEIIDSRNCVYDNMSNLEKIKTNEKLASNISKLMVVIERYPELKASKNFEDLSNQLIQVEEDIANSRKYYNGTVRMYNNKIEMLPNNIFAKLFSYKKKDMFMVSSDERKNVKVEL